MDPPPSPARPLSPIAWGVILLAALVGAQMLAGFAVSLAFFLSSGADASAVFRDLLASNATRPSSGLPGFGEGWTALLLLSAAASSAAAGIPLSLVAIRNRFGSLEAVWGRPSWRAVAHGLLGFALILGLGLALEATAGQVAKETFESSPQARLTGVLARPEILAASIPVAGLLAPAGEEFVFRGFFFRAFEAWLRTRWGPRRTFWGAALFSSLPWAAVHGDPVVMPLIVAFGVVLCWTFARAKSIVAPLVAHQAWNTLTLVALALFKV